MDTRRPEEGERSTMRRLSIFVAVLATVLVMTETHAFAQRNYGGGSRVRETPSMRGRGRQNNERNVDRRSDRSRARESKGTVYENGRKSYDDLLNRNERLSTRLQALLGDRDLSESAAGFKNFGQFIAAAHVSKNLDIPFDRLKYEMTNPDSPKSLGKAIRQLRPDVSAWKESRKANKQAKKDLKETSG